MLIHYSFFEFRATLESSFRAGGNYRCGTATFFDMKRPSFL
ncbi:hypothetical protein NMA510612_0491 [Neisseria meningitidis]|uniref:Uncharacterized protein n=1 Tax=Neisseria meningitidis TaxID=487 RepID=X5EMZ1_NEIME|nr:hypothetical protein NMA510612_0491 [Neisseria meningitidis]